MTSLVFAISISGSEGRTVPVTAVFIFGSDDHAVLEAMYAPDFVLPSSLAIPVAAHEATV